MSSVAPFEEFLRREIGKNAMAGMHALQDTSKASNKTTNTDRFKLRDKVMAREVWVK